MHMKKLLSLMFILLVGVKYAQCLTEKKASPGKKQAFALTTDNSSLEVSGKFKLEDFYGNNLTMLNDENGNLDRILVPVRHTFDMNFLYGYGAPLCGDDFVKFKTTIRNKSIWGAPETIASTDDATIKLGPSVTGRHRHPITKHVLWIREIWFDAVLNRSSDTKHTITAGFFPFQLGRGISLGDAYSVDPEILGYYSPNAVDQYAPGIKISGDLRADGRLGYDIYGAILYCRTNSFDAVNEKIRGQEYGHLYSPQRDFGAINWLIAGRLRLTPIKGDVTNLYIEPYALCNNTSEQKVEFLGDANAVLGTFGCDVEFKAGKFEYCFECACNVGHQYVKGWDHNSIAMRLRNGYYVAVNDDVSYVNACSEGKAGDDALFTRANRAIVDSCPQTQSLNGYPIGGNLQNSYDRFNDPYKNKFGGFMVVADAVYHFCDGLQAAAAFGIASGDDNPNRDLNEINDSNVDGDYLGFQGLQELYSGLKVHSAYFMNVGSTRVPRVLSFPSPSVSNQYPQTVSRFTNVIYTGCSADIAYKDWSINPNIISYWEEHPTRKFDEVAGHFVESLASPWMGIESNLFVDVKFSNQIKFFIVGALFFPGTFYADIKGRPLSDEQQRYLASLQRTGIPAREERTPLVGDDMGYNLNIGMEYKF